MMTLFASLLGFTSSTVPTLLRFWQERSDRQHELLILEKQIEQMRQGLSQRVDEINVQADINQSAARYPHNVSLSKGTWVDTLRASVRPVLTYAFFLLFTLVKLCALYVLVVDQQQTVAQALPQIWDQETHALFAAVMAFWFGQRALAKHRSLA